MMAKWLTRRLKIVIVTGTLTGFFLLLGVQMVEKGRMKSQVKSSGSGTMSRRLSYAYDISLTGNVSQLSFSCNTTVEATDKAIYTSYLVAFHYYEQQTQALRNYLQFQCLGHSFGMKIVEPFIYKSSFSFPFGELIAGNELLTLGDLIDLDLWNQQTSTEFAFPPVSSWANFLQSAPKNVIIGCIKYRNSHRFHPPSPGFNYRTGCPPECFSSFDRSLFFLKKHGFQLVRKACANFIDFSGTATEDSFYENLLGNLQPNNVTVLLNEFRGFFGLTRLPVLSECGIKHHKAEININPSAMIMRDAKRYISNVFHNKLYVAILVRVERVVLHLHHNITICSKSLQEMLNNLRKTHSVNKYFLAMDVGRFGSHGAALNHLQGHGEVILNAVYKGSWTFQEWEESFLKFASHDNPAYVANLQRAIAAKSHCVIMVGEGGFQAQARALYERLLPAANSRCVHKLCNEHLLEQDDS